jgi:hypothetical protein
MNIKVVTLNFFLDIKNCVDKYDKKSQRTEFSDLEQSLALRVSAITITILSAMVLSGAAAAFVAGSAGFIPLAAVSGLGFIAGHDLATVGNNMSIRLNPMLPRNLYYTFICPLPNGDFSGTIIKKMLMLI